MPGFCRSGARNLTEKKPDQTLEHRVNKLASDLVDAQRQISWMKGLGGFTDAISHSKRAARAEERIEVLETKVEALLDVAAHNVALMEDHIGDRHDVDLNRGGDDALDAVNFRRMKNRLRVLAEKLGLLNKRRDLTETRRSENRLRPQQAANP